MIGNMSFNMQSVTAKTDDTVLKMNDKKTYTKTKSTVSNQSFVDVLKSKSDTKTDNNKKIVSNTKKDIKDVLSDDKSKSLQELKDELEELKDEAEKSGNTDLAELLAQMLNMLNKFMQQNNGSTNSDSLKDSLTKLIEKILTSSDNADKKDKLNELMKLFKSDDSGMSLKDLTSQIKEITSMLSDNKNDNTVKDKVSDIVSRLSNTNNSSKKENTVNMNLTANNQQSSVNDENSNQSAQSNMSKSDDTQSSSSDNDSKVLKGILDDNNSNGIFNKINQAAQKTQTVVKVDGNIVNKVTIVDDIIKDVKFMATTDLKELTVKINPKELGELTIKLVSQDNGVMKAEIKANTKDAYNLLNQSLSDIKDKLSGENIKINEVSVELYQEDTTFYKNGEFSSMFSQNGSHENDERNYVHSSNASQNSEDSQDDEVKNLAKEDSSINYFA